MSRYNRYRPTINNRYNTNRINRTNKNANNTNDTNKDKDDFINYTPQQIRSWKTVHTKAKYAVTKEKRDKFERYVRFLAIRFPCGKCRNHIGVYLRQNPIPKVLGDKTIYRWAWDFHNSVNKRLGKSVVSWEQSLKFYEDL